MPQDRGTRASYGSSFYDPLRYFSFPPRVSLHSQLLNEKQRLLKIITCSFTARYLIYPLVPVNANSLVLSNVMWPQCELSSTYFVQTTKHQFYYITSRNDGKLIKFSHEYPNPRIVRWCYKTSIFVSNVLAVCSTVQYNLIYFRWCNWIREALGRVGSDAKWLVCTQSV